MVLWDMLDKTLYYQHVFIYTHNTYNQHMLLFKGIVDDARKDAGIWDYLMCNVDLYEYYNGILILYVVDEYYDETIENRYLNSDKWTDENRPWLHKTEVYEKIEKYMNS